MHGPTKSVPPGLCAPQVREGLGHLDPYFSKLADAMVAWIEVRLRVLW